MPMASACGTCALYDDLVVIDGDVGAPAFKDAARNLRSNRYFNMGIAEQNMILTSAGRASLIFGYLFHH